MHRAADRVYFAGIHSFATQLNEYKQSQDMDNQTVKSDYGLHQNDDGPFVEQMPSDFVCQTDKVVVNVVGVNLAVNGPVPFEILVL